MEINGRWMLLLDFMKKHKWSNRLNKLQHERPIVYTRYKDEGDSSHHKIASALKCRLDFFLNRSIFHFSTGDRYNNGSFVDCEVICQNVDLLVISKR